MVSMMGMLVRRVVQPGLLRASVNSESKGNETYQGSERCLFEDMHLASQKAEPFRYGVGNGHANRQMREGARNRKF